MKINNVNQLVQDRVLDAIAKKGEKAEFRTITEESELLQELKNNLNEAIITLELHSKLGKIKPILESLADLILLNDTIAKVSNTKKDKDVAKLFQHIKKFFGMSNSAVVRACNIRNRIKGRYHKKIFLIKTETND